MPAPSDQAIEEYRSAVGDEEAASNPRYSTLVMRVEPDFAEEVLLSLALSTKESINLKLE